MKVKEFIEGLQKLDQESEIFYLEEKQDGEEFLQDIRICVTRERMANSEIKKYYTIEKVE